MLKCKNDPTRLYKGSEPSPTGLGYCAPAEELNTKKKGKDGNIWKVIETKSGVKRWIKDNNAEYVYITHDNGSRPFSVNIKNKEVNIYKRFNDDSSEEYDDLITTYNFQKVFIGKSPLNKMTEFSEGYGPDFDGNTVLIKLNNSKYVYIGDGIYEFDIENDKIIDYISPVGNNNVPYPIAIGENYLYFLVELLHYKPRVPRDKFPEELDIDAAWDLFFGKLTYMNGWISELDPYKTKVLNVKIIHHRLV